MIRGEVWWVETPYARRRPYLILTRNAAIPLLERLFAVPATTTIRGIATEVLLEPSDGMPAECVLTVDNAETIRKVHFVERVCQLDPSKVRAVCDVLSLAVECS